MSAKVSTLRLIGGKWRSRKISFSTLPGVRPTTNVTRETLFNWLAPVITCAKCLDLFAGSGALGFEALSRGACHVVMVDTSMQVIKCLKANAERLSTNNVDFYCAEIPKNLDKIPPQPFEIVFLDPPFHHQLIQPTCERLQADGYLAKQALVYVEAEKNLVINEVIPKSWQILRHKTSGLVGYYLLQAE